MRGTLTPHEFGHRSHHSNTPYFTAATSPLAKEMDITALRNNLMDMLAQALPFAAIGYSLVYLLAGGGLFGAVVIFIIAKMLGK